MSKIKGGAPKKAVKRERCFNVYLTEQECVLMKERAGKAGFDLSTYGRNMILRGRVLSRLTEEDKALFRDLVGISNDLHRSVKLAREGGELASLLEACRDRIDTLLQKIKL